MCYEDAFKSQGMDVEARTITDGDMVVGRGWCRGGGCVLFYVVRVWG